MQWDLGTIACTTPYRKVFIFCMGIIFIIIVIHIVRNIFRFFQTKKRLRVLKIPLDPQAYSGRRGTLFQDILGTFSAFDKNEDMAHSRRYYAMKSLLLDKIEGLFLKRNLFVFLSLIAVILGALKFIISLVEILYYISTAAMPEYAIICNDLNALLKLQIFTLVMVTLSATAHLSSKNMVKSISGEITTLEIRMLENHHYLNGAVTAFCAPGIL
jgi:hypothetical protein